MKMTGCYLLMLAVMACAWMTVTASAYAGTYDLIFRDQVEKKKMNYRPAESDYQQVYADDYQKPGYSKPAYEGDYKQKPYEPEYKPAQKPYKPKLPKPEYPKQVVLLTPSAALKPQAYSHKHTTKDYYHAGSIPGVAGKDYPNYSAIPATSFDCQKVKSSVKSYDEYNYMVPDTETGCQVFHSCHADGRQDSFLCPEGTIFDGETQTCDWWYSARCY